MWFKNFDLRVVEQKRLPYFVVVWPKIYRRMTSIENYCSYSQFDRMSSLSWVHQHACCSYQRATDENQTMVKSKIQSLSASFSLFSSSMLDFSHIFTFLSPMNFTVSQIVGTKLATFWIEKFAQWNVWWTFFSICCCKYNRKKSSNQNMMKFWNDVRHKCEQFLHLKLNFP